MTLLGNLFIKKQTVRKASPEKCKALKSEQGVQGLSQLYDNVFALQNHFAGKYEGMILYGKCLYCQRRNEVSDIALPSQFGQF
jgi:hypothetical protein